MFVIMFWNYLGLWLKMIDFNFYDHMSGLTFCAQWLLNFIQVVCSLSHVTHILILKWKIKIVYWWKWGTSVTMLNKMVHKETFYIVTRVVTLIHLGLHYKNRRNTINKKIQASKPCSTLYPCIDNQAPNSSSCKTKRRN